MAFSLQTKTVQPGDTATFDFDSSIAAYTVGISNYNFTFGSDDEHIQEIEIALSANQPSANQLTVKTTGILQDSSGHSINKGSSSISVVAVAWTGAPTSGVVLASRTGISTGTRSADITLPTSTPQINQAFLAGLELAYAKDHHVQLIQADAGVQLDGSLDYITSTAKMLDNDGNIANIANIDGGLLATSSDDVGLLIQPVNNKQTSTKFSVAFGADLRQAVVLLTNYKVRYESNKDHHLRTVGGGCSCWRIDPENARSVILDNAYSYMSDDSGKHQDDNQSEVSLVVLGVF